MKLGLGLKLGGSAPSGPSLGPELITNGGFDDASSWTTEPTVTISGGKANFVSAAQLGDNLYQLGVIPTAGTPFTLSFTVSGYTTGSVRPYAGNQALGSTVSANGTYTFTGQDRGAGNANLVFKGQDAGGTTLSIDDVSLKVEL